MRPVGSVIVGAKTRGCARTLLKAATASRSNKENILHLVDFGLSKKYVTSDSGTHIPFKKKKGAGSGTMRYMSINTHLGKYTVFEDEYRPKSAAGILVQPSTLGA